MDTQMDDEVPIFDEKNYSAWRIEMKGYLKEKGEGVWKVTIGGSVPLKNKSKFAAQKEEKKNDALALKTIFNGLSSSVKESMGQCTSAKDLWLKLEKTYQGKKEDTEDNSIKNNEGKESPKSSDCNNSKCDDVECFSTSEEENLEVVCVESDDSYPIDEEEDLLKLKDKVLSELDDVSSEIGHYSISFEYLEKYTKEVLEKYPRYTMALKKMLKEQEESKKTQLEEKEEEIKRLKNEIEEKKKVDDELSKSLEVNVNLKTKIEEAKRIEELLKNQVNEKEESCHKLEAEVVDLRKKVEKSNTHIKFMNNSTILDEILDSQRSPNDKSGLGYNKEAIHLEASTSKKHEVSPSFSKGGSNVASQPSTQRKETFKRTKKGRHQEAIFTPQRKFRRETPSRWTPKQRYENVFHGHCYSCNEYGHKDLDCRHYARKDNGRFHNTLRCWRCNQVGHIVAHCHTMRCYSCSGFGHKSQDCWNTRRQSMRSASYSMTRRTHEARKEDNFENMEAQSSSSEKLGHLQKWMKKTEQPEQNGSHEASSSLIFSEAYAGSCGRSHVHT
jgi:hypothetical protein